MIIVMTRIEYLTFSFHSNQIESNQIESNSTHFFFTKKLFVIAFRMIFRCFSKSLVRNVTPKRLRNHRQCCHLSSPWMCCPKQHVWIRPTDIRDSSESFITVNIGFTNLRVDRMGDLVECVPSLRQPNVSVGDELIRIQWEGFAQTEADELYHTVWENIEGTESLLAPIAGTILRIYDEKCEIDESTPLVSMTCSLYDYDHTIQTWVDEKTYSDMIREGTVERGSFSDIV